MSSKNALLPSSKKKMDFAQGKAIIQLNKKVNKLYKANQVDTHFFDTAQTLSPGTTASIGYLTSVAQGDTEQSRDGDSIALKYLQMKMTVVPHVSSASDSFRLILFRWKAPAGGNPPSAAAILATASNIDSPYNRDYRESLVVLYDRNIDASPVNGNKHVTIKKALNNVACTFIGASGANYNENHIWFLFLATDNVNKASVNYYSRITFLP